MSVGGQDVLDPAMPVWFIIDTAKKQTTMLKAQRT